MQRRWPPHHRWGGIRLELPLAAPLVVAGIRTGAVQVVATATLGAIFGFGGLGRYLIDGYAAGDYPQIWGGAVLVAALAITTELVFVLLQRRLTPRGLRLQQAHALVETRIAAIPAAGE